MKVFTIIILLMVLTSPSVVGQKSVLFLVGAGQNATGPEEADNVVLDLLEAQGWDVEVYYLDDPSKMTQDLGLDKDLVVISSTISSSHVGNFYMDKEVPVLTWEQGMYGKLGIATGGNILMVSETKMTITQVGHPAVGTYTGEVEVLSTLPNELTLTSPSQFGPELQVIAEMVADDGSVQAAIFAYEKGAALLDGSPAPARRMGFFFRDKTATEATTDCLNILALCCKWTMGIETTSISELKMQIADLQLLNNYPNPFNPATRIVFSLPKAENVTLIIYNCLGQSVRTLISGEMREGVNTVHWDGCDDEGYPLPSGVYYSEMKANSKVMRGKMVLLR